MESPKLAPIERVETRFAKLRATLTPKRKVSLPMFMAQFHQQWVPNHTVSEDEENVPNGDTRSGVIRKVKKLSSYQATFGSCASLPIVVKKERKRGLSISFSSKGEAEISRRHSTVSSPKYTPMRTTEEFTDFSYLPSGNESIYSAHQVKMALREQNVAQYGGSAQPIHSLLVATVSSPGGTTVPAVIAPRKQMEYFTPSNQKNLDADFQKIHGKEFPLESTKRLTSKESNLRQAESLEGLNETPTEKEQSVSPETKSVYSAISLPQIHQLSDYEDDPNIVPSRHSNKHASHHSLHEPSTTNKNATPKRTKKKRTNLRRRPATREKDGRSKSLTQIDHLVDNSNGMLLLGSQVEDRREESGGSRTHTDKLGIPDDQSMRRPQFSMDNRVLSGEFITMIIECIKETYEEFVLSAKGVTLREALETRGLEMSGIDAFQECNRIPIPLHTDTSQLAGKCIHVRVKDDGRSILRSRSAQIPKKSRFMWGGSSAEEYSMFEDRANGPQSSQEGSLKAKSNKTNNRWSLFQPNTKDSKMDDLVHQLDLYSKNGIPKLPHLLPCQSQDEENEIHLEESWRTLVKQPELLSEREEHRNSAVWELVKTEATYINMLKVITDLFLACLCNLQNERILNEIDTEKLFNNIQDIYEANLTFWNEHICLMLTESRKDGTPLDPTLLADGFFKFGEIFRPYTQYCLEQTDCQLYCKFHSRENNHFRAYLAWCETQKECNRLKLVDILVHPMQRLTRYSILLKAILKKTDDEEQATCIKSMIVTVDRFVSKVNSALRNCHEHERLKQIIKKIDLYDAVEAKDEDLAAVLKQHSELNLLQKMPGCPGHIPRWLLHQADFKFKDAHASKMDVHVFIFTDCLLVTKVTQRKAEKVKVIRPPYRIDKLILVELKDPLTHGVIHLSDWGVAAAAFTLQSSDAKSHKSMYDSFHTARKLYQESRVCFNQPSTSYDMEDEISTHLPPRSPRFSSPRNSRMSSLVHSHSGSMDLNEGSTYVSPGGHHPPSVDLSEIRASSASSEDSLPQAEIQRSKSLEGQHTCASLRPDRRIVFPKSPNTLSVTPPYATGQSMPNLNAETSSNSLRVPSHKSLSAGTRGVSYPPPSPRTLKRCPQVPQSRNPPLLKTKRVASVVSSPLETSGAAENSSEAVDDHSKRRLFRGERLENRRYLTAGAIDDLKKQDSKDSSIHKRLSWNYGQGPPPPPRDCDELMCNRMLTKNIKTASKSISTDSVQSSSGVSSTSSLQRCEYEILENIDDEEGISTVDLPLRECSTSLKLSPHISTTYICHDSDITLGHSASQYITQPVEESQETSKPGVKNVKESDSIGIASVQITVNDSTNQPLPSKAPSSPVKSSSSFSSNSSLTSSSSVRSTSSGESLKPETHTKEILLSDVNLETSDV